MRGRAFRAAAMLALLAGCGSGTAPSANRQDAAPAPPPVDAAVPRPASGTNRTAEAPADEVALASLSRGQRRAYEQGLGDCRAGRYRPADHPEAYRIGCAAAHDRQGPP